MEPQQPLPNFVGDLQAKTQNLGHVINAELNAFGGESEDMGIFSVKSSHGRFLLITTLLF